MPTLAARVFVNVGGDPICILQNLTLQVGDWVVLARKWSGKILLRKCPPKLGVLDEFISQGLRSTLPLCNARGSFFRV